MDLQELILGYTFTLLSSSVIHVIVTGTKQSVIISRKPVISCKDMPIKRQTQADLLSLPESVKSCHQLH